MKVSDPTLRSWFALGATCAALGLVDAFLALIGTIAPVRMYLLAALVLGAFTFALAYRRVPHRAAILAMAIAGFVAVLAWWPMHGRKSFFRDVDALELGATRVDVHERMSDWPQGHPYGESVMGLFYVPDPRVDLWHHNGASRIDNVDHVVVHYDDADRVRAVERIVD
jgi:hypothetical protein